MNPTQYLRISNRGSNTYAQETNTVCAVNLQVGLRNRGACVIECVHSTTEIISLPLDTIVLEIGLQSNINISGYDTRTSGNCFTADGYKILNVFDLDNEIRTDGTHDRKLTTHGTKTSFSEMHCSSLPETIQFGLYKVDSANDDVLEKLTNAGYVSFTLKIQFLG